jgi:hypothetical protein
MPDLHERASAAYGYVQELTKQLITLSTAVFALTLTFADKIALAGHGNENLLQIAWVLYLVSVAFGLLTMMALTGQIAEPEVRSDGSDGPEVIDVVTTAAIRLPSLVQVLTFSAALVLTTVYGFQAV